MILWPAIKTTLLESKQKHEKKWYRIAYETVAIPYTQVLQVYFGFKNANAFAQYATGIDEAIGYRGN